MKLKAKMENREIEVSLIKKEDYKHLNKFIFESRMEHNFEGFKTNILYNSKIQVILNCVIWIVRCHVKYFK